MSAASISLAPSGELLLAGVLDYRSGPALREAGGRLIATHPAAALSLNCAAVEKSSSVGLALVLAFMRDAQAAGKSLVVCQVPADMREIAQVCELTEVLSLQA